MISPTHPTVTDFIFFSSPFRTHVFHPLVPRLPHRLFTLTGSTIGSTGTPGWHQTALLTIAQGVPQLNEKEEHGRILLAIRDNANNNE